MKLVVLGIMVEKEMGKMKKTNKEKQTVAKWEQEANAGNIEAYKHLFFYYVKKETRWQKFMKKVQKLRRKLKIVSKTSVTIEKRIMFRGKYMRKALKWVRKQQAQGYALIPEQAYFLAMDILQDTKQKDKTESIELFEYAADGGLSHAAFQLGCCYSLGEGVAKGYPLQSFTAGVDARLVSDP